MRALKVILVSFLVIGTAYAQTKPVTTSQTTLTAAEVEKTKSRLKSAKELALEIVDQGIASDPQVFHKLELESETQKILQTRLQDLKSRLEALEIKLAVKKQGATFVVLPLNAPDEKGHMIEVDLRTAPNQENLVALAHPLRVSEKSKIEIAKGIIHEAAHCLQIDPQNPKSTFYDHRFEVELTEVAEALTFIWKQGRASAIVMSRVTAPLIVPTEVQDPDFDGDYLARFAQKHYGVDVSKRKRPSTAPVKPRQAITLRISHLNREEMHRFAASEDTTLEVFEIAHPEKLIATIKPGEQIDLPEAKTYQIRWGNLTKEIEVKEGQVCIIIPEVQYREQE